MKSQVASIYWMLLSGPHIPLECVEQDYCFGGVRTQEAFGMSGRPRAKAPLSHSKRDFRSSEVLY
jgi:hypothetical protein